jgi:uncharacterized protein (TIGR03067 family)
MRSKPCNIAFLIAAVIGTTFALWLVGPAKFAAAADKLSDDAKTLIGTWTVVSATRDGKDEEGNVPIEFAFTERGLKIKFTKKLADCYYRVDASRKPAILEVIHRSDVPYSGVGNGIYEFDGNSLRLALSGPNSKPKKFDDVNQVLFVLKRKDGG